jgi:hypothetical protein
LQNDNGLFYAHKVFEDFCVNLLLLVLFCIRIFPLSDSGKICSKKRKIYLKVEANASKVVEKRFMPKSPHDDPI